MVVVGISSKFPPFECFILFDVRTGHVGSSPWRSAYLQSLLARYAEISTQVSSYMLNNFVSLSSTVRNTAPLVNDLHDSPSARTMKHSRKLASACRISENTFARQNRRTSVLLQLILVFSTLDVFKCQLYHKGTSMKPTVQHLSQHSPQREDAPLVKFSGLVGVQPINDLR